MNLQYRNWPSYYPGGFINPQPMQMPTAPIAVAMPSPVIPHAPALSAHSPVLNVEVLSESESSSDEEPPRVIYARRGRSSSPKRHKSHSRPKSKSKDSCGCKENETQCNRGRNDTKPSCPCAANDCHHPHYSGHMFPPWWFSPYRPEYPHGPYSYPQEAPYPPWKAHHHPPWHLPQVEQMPTIEPIGVPSVIMPDNSYAYASAADVPWATPAPSQSVLFTAEQPQAKKEPEKKKKKESKDIKLNPAWGKFASKQPLVDPSTLSQKKLSQITIHPMLTLETCRTLLFCNVIGPEPELMSEEQDLNDFLYDPATVPRLTTVALSLGAAGTLSITNRRGVLVGDILTQVRQYAAREIERSFWDNLPQATRHSAKGSCSRRRAAGHVSSSRVVMGDLLEDHTVFFGMTAPARGSGDVFETHWESH